MPERLLDHCPEVLGEKKAEPKALRGHIRTYAHKKKKYSKKEGRLMSAVQQEKKRPS